MECPQIDQQVIFLHCDDLVETAVFYEQLLQLPLVLDQRSYRIYQTSATSFLGFCVTLGSQLEKSDRRGIMLTSVSEDVDGWHQYLLSQGVEIEKPPTLNEKFNIYQCFIRDPNGYLIEIQTFLDETWSRLVRHSS